MSDANTDLEQYLFTYFPRRNNIDYTPVKNVGYTAETLTYMPSASVADRITNLVVKYMKQINKIPFDVYDASGGIGGSTLSFLDNPDVRHVYTYEIVPERRLMQQENVKGYNLQNKYTSYEEYKGTPESAVGSVTYFDPPWLPESSGKTGLNFSKSDYIQENTMYAGKILEQWVASLSQCALVVFRVPPGYRFHEVAGWRIDVNDDIQPRKKNVRLIIAVNLKFFGSVTTYEKKSNYTPRNEYRNEYRNDYKNDYKNKPKNESAFQNTRNASAFNQTGRERYNKDVYQKRSTSPSFKPSTNFIPITQPVLLTDLSKTVTPSVLLTDLTKSINAPVLLTDLTKNEIKEVKEIPNVVQKEIPTNQDEWKNRLYNFLSETLKNIKVPDNIILQFLSVQNFPTWIDSFTEDSFDPLHNYDVLEVLGDKILDAAFAQYLMKRFKTEIAEGKINEKGISNLRIEYMSKIKQAGLSYKLRLPEFVRINPNLSLSVHIVEDIFEAFFGALFTVGEDLSPGYGFTCCFLMIEYLFSDIVLDQVFLYDPSKTYINQTFNEMGWGKTPKIFKNKEGDKYVFDIYFTDSAYNFLKREGFKIVPKLSSGTGNTELTAETNAFFNAVQNIIKIGVTNEWLQIQKFNREFNELVAPELAVYLPKLREKMKQDGYIRIEFEVSKTGSDDNVRLLQLKARKAGYQRLFLLGTELITDNERNSTKYTSKHISLLKKYIGE